MKKFTTITCAMMMAFMMTACGGSRDNHGMTETEQVLQTELTEEVQTPATVMVEALNGASEVINVEVPYNPQVIVTLDAASTDILSNIGVADRIVGTTTPEAYLADYVDGAANVGTAKTFDVEEIMELQPDVIFMSGRGSEYYDTLVEIAPVVRLSVNGNVVEGTYQNAMKMASIFGMEEEMSAKLSAYDERIAAISAVAEDKSAIIGLCTSGAFNLLGDDGRCSILGNELGFRNIGVDADIDTSSHGNEASFEFVVDKAPDYIFVLDRDAATNAEGAQLAKDIMENELIMSTDAYKNGNMIIMENPSVWYKAEGGFTALGIMLADIENALFAE